MSRRVIVLAPQGHAPTVGECVRDLGLDGPVGTVTAGWEEREAEDAELVADLQGGAVNLGLFPRAEEVFREAPRVRGLLYERYDRLCELQGLYRLRLAPLLQACRALLARTDPAAPDALHGPEIEDGIASVRALDAHHLARVTVLDAEIVERLHDAHEPVLDRHKDEVARVLDGVSALLVAGGHVGILLNRLRLFDVLPNLGEKPVVAWSGGAMVLTERIVLFHDSPPQGPGEAEVYAPGLGLIRGLVPLPHARHRLRLDDPARVALFARRFAPDRCIPLDAGERLDGVEGGTEWTPSHETLVLSETGGVAEAVA